MSLRGVEGSQSAVPLTRPLFDLLHRDLKNRKDLHHDLDHRIHHFGSRRHLRVKRRDKFSMRPNTLMRVSWVERTFLICLGNVGVTMARAEGQSRIRTGRRTPTPTNLAFSG